jgi:ribosome-associated protein
MHHLPLPESEVEITAIRAQGPGGQNVNKVSSAILLRLDVRHCSLPEAVRARWLAASDNHLTPDGVLILKAQRFRTQQANRQDAWSRLLALIQRFERVPKTRKPTRPTRASVRERLQRKARHGLLKAGRRQTDV